MHSIEAVIGLAMAVLVWTANVLLAIGLYRNRDRH